MKRVLVLAVAGVSLAACSSDGGSAASTAPAVSTTTTAVEATTTTAASTTTLSSTTTTTVPTPTTTQFPGVVYGAENAPTFKANGITARILSVGHINLDNPATDSDAFSKCSSQIDYERAATKTCIFVAWEFDVAADFRVDEYSPEGTLSPDDYIGPDGIAHSQAIIATGYPGTLKNTIYAVYPETAAGGTVRFQTGSNLVRRTTHSFTVPADLPPG
jgi:hypothetical protein